MSSSNNVSDRQVLILRPLAQKLMDLTLGRYQILEHHRHRIPEFLAMCALDVESFLAQFSKLDLERALKDARAAQMVGGATSGGKSAGSTESTSSEVTSPPPPQQQEDVDDEQDDDLDAWCKRMPPAELIPALKQRCERTKATELFLRSTVSDLISDLEKKEVALDTLGGQIRRRDERLAGLREAFLRENRQIREILRQFREKGKCDLPDPILYEWDDNNNTNDSSGNGVGTTPRKGAPGGRAGSAGDDPVAAMRATFDAEKEQLERGFVKQLEEAKFRVRSLEAQLANLARARSELQQQVASLQQRIGDLEAERGSALRDTSAAAEAAGLAPDDVPPPRTEQPLTESAGVRTQSAGKLDSSTIGSLSPPHHSSTSLTSPRADAGAGGSALLLNPKQSGLSAESRVPSTSSPRSSSNRSPRGSNTSLKAGIAAMSLSTIAVVRATDTVATQTDRELMVTPPPGSATFALDVDQQLQEVLSARQPTPDGLGAGVMRSISTVSQPTRQKELASGKAAQSSSAASTTPRTAASSNSKGVAKAAASAKRGVHGASQAATPVAAAAVAAPTTYATHSPVRILSSPVGGTGNSSLASPRSPGSTLNTHDGVMPLEGTSPWGDDQPPAATVTSALETSASTPSQLEKVKRGEEIAAKAGAALRNTQADGAAGSKHPPQQHLRGDAALLRELDKLRQENLELRHSLSGPVVSSTAPQNSAALLKKLKEELHNKSALLDEKSAELEQLKLETMRWFSAYKRAVPPSGQKDAPLPRAQGGDGLTSALAGRHIPPSGDDLLVNYEVVAMLKTTVAAADEAEEAYRVLSWKLIRDGVRYAMALIAQETDCAEARRHRDAATLIRMQRGMDLVDHRAKTHLGRVRRQRAAARVQANRLWDRVLVLAKGVCSLDPIPDAPFATPRCTTRSSGNSLSSPKPPPVEIVPHREEQQQMQPTSQHSAYFRAASAAAAEFTLQRLNAPPIPTRGISAVSPQTFLPQRPQSATVSRPAIAGDPDEIPTRLNEAAAGGDSKPTFSQKLRGAVVRPTSAAMMTRLHPKQRAGHVGKERPSSAGPSATATVAEVEELPPPSAFSPSELRHLCGTERRSYVVAALTRDKLAAAHEKRQLAEERYAQRASACATIPPDMKRDDAAGLMQTVKLVGRNESNF